MHIFCIFFCNPHWLYFYINLRVIYSKSSKHCARRNWSSAKCNIYSPTGMPIQLYFLFHNVDDKQHPCCCSNVSHSCYWIPRIRPILDQYIGDVFPCSKHFFSISCVTQNILSTVDYPVSKFCISFCFYIALFFWKYFF